MKRKYTYSDFISDYKFIEWRLMLNEESDDYWRAFVDSNPESADALAEAVEKFKSLRLNSDNGLSTAELEKMVDGTVRRINSFRIRRRRRITAAITSSAAAVIVFGSIFFSGILDRHEIVRDNFVIYTTISENVRIMSGDNIVELDNNSYINIPVSANVAEIIRNDTRLEIPLDKKAFNIIEVPAGKRSVLHLPDGTLVWINSGSTFEFPAVFEKDRRDVRVSGEVFLDVAHSESSPFYIHTREYDLLVHGTSFNVNSYADEDESFVVLVEGSVTIQTRDDRIFPLEPDYKLSFNKTDGTVSKQKVDVTAYTCWKDGYLMFTDATMDEMLAKIKRYYNLEIQKVGGSGRGKTQTYSGKLHLSPDVADVISAISLFAPLEYELCDDAPQHDW